MACVDHILGGYGDSECCWSLQVNSLVNGAIQDNQEAMVILESILPTPIILRLQVKIIISLTCRVTGVEFLKIVTYAA